ncbi:MAG TPA: hypothetical protein VKT81_24685 [Bryobacteraceae bacterium]|nr:hypothetical protein [Bryobacteraceae bacterium]
MGQAVQMAPALAEPRIESAPGHWSLAKRIAFRFVFSYFMLYNLPMAGHVNLLEAVPGVPWLSEKYQQLWHTIVPWVAIHVFHLSGPVTVYPAVNGSGDTTLDYIENLLLLVTALLATIAWSAIDYKRREYARLNFYFRVYTRYALSFTLFGYGFAKVIPTQFIFPSLSRLIEPFGEFSPMGVLWNFMGYSTAYVIFSGLAEVTGATLLLFRRTATLGAMASAAVLLNVVMLNFCYDVPVKLYSSNLLLMAIFLMAPDLGRLANLLVLNRPTEPVNLAAPPLAIRGIKPHWLKTGAVVFQIVFVGYFLYGTIKGGWEGYKGYVLNRPKPPIYGLYEVESFTSPNITDATRWRRVAISSPAAFTARMMDESSHIFNTEYDEKKNTVTVDKKSLLNYTRPDAEHVVLAGDSLVVKLKRIDPSKFLLVNRGFHWINERPFNK